MLDAMHTMQIMIVDSQTIVAESLRRVMERDGNFAVGTAQTLAEMRDLLNDGHYEVVLIDYGLKDFKSIDAVKDIVQEFAPTKFALFSHDLENSAVVGALKAGFVGYVPKTMGVESLIACVNLLASGEPYVPLNYIAAINADMTTKSHCDNKLSKPDIGMIEMIEQGKTNKEIGRHFGISESRVKMLLRSIYGKLHANNRAHVVAIAHGLGII